MPVESVPKGDEARLLALFTGVGPLTSGQPSAKAWLAADTSTPTNQAVIIKRVPSARKGRATESLTLLHPHIARTRRWIAGDTGFIYVVRDVVRGKNLRQSLASSSGTRPSPELIRRLLIPVLDALAYAHSHNVCHGGLSPDNIILTDTQHVMVTDWATADPSAPHHSAIYKGEATVLGDVRAAGRILSAYLPMSGAFSNPQVRGRIEGVINRCDTLADLRATLETLEKLAASPAPKAARPADFDLDDAPPKKQPTPQASQQASQTSSDLREKLRDFDTPKNGTTNPTPPPIGGPSLFCQSVQGDGIQVAVGGGGAGAMTLQNDGTASLIIRMIATQHAWVNVRPIELPLTLAPGASARVEFAISAARLSPGQYRSEVYISANANGAEAQDLRGGWFKHTCELRVHVVEAIFGTGNAPANGVPAFPENAPRLPAAPLGCGGSLLVLPFVLLFAAAYATIHALFA